MVTFDIDTDIDEARCRSKPRQAGRRAAPAGGGAPARRDASSKRLARPSCWSLAPRTRRTRPYDQVFISNYATAQREGRDEARIPGVDNVTLFGRENYAMRIWLDPERIALRSMTADDGDAAMRRAERAGRRRHDRSDATAAAAAAWSTRSLQPQGRLLHPAEFGQNIVRSQRRRARRCASPTSRVWSWAR